MEYKLRFLSTSGAHAQSNILHSKYGEKTDDSGLGFGV